MLKYRGNGNHLAGIPARDLNDEEVKLFGGEKKLIKTGLYEKPVNKGVNKKASGSDEQCQE